jgi:preprotein translocase subunit SecG
MPPRWVICTGLSQHGIIWNDFKQRGEASLLTYLYIVQIILAIAVIIAAILNSRGSDLGSVFGGGEGIYRTRRGVERTLFNAMIVLSVLFFAVSLATVMVQG